MATLEKLSICGIRSFGYTDEDQQLIKFERPLTLILGENGCGKSTIIECLRYITTQREPAGKASVFVHDPQLVQMSSVKGFIKLRYRDVTGSRKYLSKVLQATQNKKSLTTKTLDSCISWIDPVTKERKTSSNRCVDIGPMVTSSFGVSRAILENVIFCTQEDAHWPLDTDQKLKEKFDQIFDSDRYNKCINKIRDERKKITMEIKKSEIEIRYLRENKKSAMDKRNAVIRLETELINMDEQLEQFENKIKDIHERLSAAHQVHLQVTEVETLLMTNRTEYGEAQKRVSELRKQIQEGFYEFLGSDEDLQNALSNFAHQVDNTSKLKSSLIELNDKEQAISKEMMEVQGQLGQLGQLEKLNTEKEQLLQKNIQIAAQELKAAPNLLGIKSQVAKLQADFTDLQTELEVIEDALQAEVDESRSKLVTRENILKKKEEDLAENEKEVTELSNELEVIDSSQSKLAKLTVQLEKVKRDLEDHQNNVNADDLKAQLKRCGDEIKETEDELSLVENKIQLLQVQSQQLSEIEILNDNLHEKKNDFRRLKNKHEATLKRLLGSLPENGFKTAVDDHLNKLKVTYEKMQEEENGKSREMAALENEKRHLQEQINEKNSYLLENETKIMDLTFNESQENLNKTVDDLQKELEELQIYQGTFESSKYMYKQYIHGLSKPNPCCPLCKRGFPKVEEARSLSEELQSKLETLPSQEENNIHIKSVQQLLQKKQTLEPAKQKVTELKTELEKAQQRYAFITANLQALAKEVFNIDEDKIKPNKEMAECSAILADMTILDQNLLEQQKIRRHIAELEARLPKGGSKETLKEATDRQENLRRSIKSAKYRRDDLQDQLNKFYDRLQMYQKTKDSLTEDIRKISACGNRKEMEERLGGLSGKREMLRSDIIEARSSLRALNDDLQEKIRALKNGKDNNKMTLQTKRREMENIVKKVEHIENIMQEVEDFAKKNLAEKIAKLRNEISELETKRDGVKVKKEEINMQLTNLSKSDSRRRELEDNLSYRKKLKDCETFQKNVAECDSKLFELKLDKNFVERDQLQREISKINDQKSEIGGRRGAIKQQVVEVKKELDSKLFRTVDDDFKKELINLEVNKALNNDLFRYATTMEYAVVTYHKQQMEKVNAFVREYWRNIYQGNDIDYIEILTEECEVTEKRRNYSYKLVQVKGDVRLDMRNRCSAGQKMLASLIIRMALAETFSNNCGILTLDEPTTNLDRKNIHNLARTLSELLTEKEKIRHSNFQLIVITHDEAFLQELIQIDAIDSYVEVSRDHRGKSRVNMKSVAR